MASTKVFGKIDLRWQSNTVVLPVDKAAQFMALYAEGLYRQNGTWEKPGLTRCDHEGQELSLPSMDVITSEKLHTFEVRGAEADDEQRAERAAKEAAEKNEASLNQMVDDLLKD